MRSYTPRSVTLNQEQLARVLAVLETRPALIRLAFLTLLLTGCRRNELLAMQRQDLDLVGGTWHLPRTKSRQPHTLCLPPQLVSLYREQVIPGPYVFSYTHTEPWGPTTLRNYWLAIAKEASCLHVHIHDLRRTLATNLCQAGVPIQVVSWILNHARIRTTELYVHGSKGSSPIVRDVLSAYSAQLLNGGSHETPTTLPPPALA